MTPSDDPFALLPFAVAGLIVGAGMAFGGGYGLHQQWGEAQRTIPPAGHVTVDGRIEWAGWRQSRVRDGPAWYLQLRIAGDDRGFLVSAASLSERDRARFGEPTARQPIPVLEGKQASLVIDSALSSSNPTPYLSALRVEGKTIIPFEEEADPPAPLWKRVGWGLLLGMGLLVGVGMFIASLQHIVVCVRHGRQ